MLLQRWMHKYGNVIIAVVLTIFFCFLFCMSGFDGVRDPRCDNVDHKNSHKQHGSLLGNSYTESSKRIYAFLVVLVLTAPDNRDRRNAIRTTWLANRPKYTEPYFVLGIKGISPEILARLRLENDIHSDLLLLPNVEDAYQQLTIKVLEAFKWVDSNIDSKFIVKVDDDSFARLEKIHDELVQGKISERLYWGFFVGNARVYRSGTWAEKEWTLCDRYLPYARGGGYVLSCDLVHYIAYTSSYLKLYKSEDVSVGAWLGPLDIQRKHDPRFDTEYKSRGCNNEYLITHKQSIDMMKEKHQNLYNNEKLCKTEVQERISYIYNWEKLPSQCCVRDNRKIP